MFPDLKIAFCISGEPRQYKNCYRNLLSYIEENKRLLMHKWGPESQLAQDGRKLVVVGKHKLGDIEYKETGKKFENYADPSDFTVTVDIFIHCWNTVTTHRNYRKASVEVAKDKEQHITYDIDELRDDLIEKYNPKRILVESKDVMEDLHLYFMKNELIRCQRTGKKVDFFNVNSGEELPYVEIEDLIDSNYLALMQHISGQRAAYLKMGKDIPCQSADIVGDAVPNDYDIVVKTRTDVLYSAYRAQLARLISGILNFEGTERTPNGMTYFIHQNIRNGNLAVSLTQWWSNNKQFDMFHDKLVEKLLTYEKMPIRHTCHHDMIGYHIQQTGISSRETFLKENSPDFLLYVPNIPEEASKLIQELTLNKDVIGERNEQLGIVTRNEYGAYIIQEDNFFNMVKNKYSKIYENVHHERMKKDLEKPIEKKIKNKMIRRRNMEEVKGKTLFVDAEEEKKYLAYVKKLKKKAEDETYKNWITMGKKVTEEK